MPTNTGYKTLQAVKTEGCEENTEWVSEREFVEARALERKQCLLIIIYSPSKKLENSPVVSKLLLPSETCGISGDPDRLYCLSETEAVGKEAK